MGDPHGLGQLVGPPGRPLSSSGDGDGMDAPGSIWGIVERVLDITEKVIEILRDFGLL
jgi:hypothetical protein